MLKNKTAYIITILSIFMNMLLFWSGAYDYLEEKLYDYRFRLRGPLSGDYVLDKHKNKEDYQAIKSNATDNDVVILGLDQISYETIGRYYPYDRAVIWSKVIDNLVIAGAEVIVFDIMFDHISNQDSIFSNSIKNAEKKGVDVILATNNIIEKEIANQDFRLIKPSKNIIEGTNVKLGLIGTVQDNDGFIRRYISIDNTIDDNYQDQYYSLALQAVISYKNEEATFDDSGIQIGDLTIPHYKNENTFLINYYGPQSGLELGTFKISPLYEILDDCNPYCHLEENTECYPHEPNCNPILKNPTEGQYESFFNFMTIDAPILNSFKNKIVIIGSTLKEHHDVFDTPFNSFNNSGEMYGVELHANAIQQILDNNHINAPLAFKGYNTDLKDKLISLVINLIFAFLIFYIISYLKPIQSIFLTVIFILFWFNIAIGAFINDYLYIFKIVLGNFNLPNINESIMLPMIYPIFSIIFSYGFNLSYKLYTENQDKKFLKNTFGNYISSDLVDQMYKSKEMPELGGKEGYHSLIFSDIASFSSFSEQLTATQLVELLNEYLTAMTQIILDNGGTVDKYIGDAIMAFYGAPLKVKNHEYKAVLSVFQMNLKLKELRKKWASEGDKWPDLVKNMQHRIGINTGNLVTGNMGSQLQMNYTCMGDTVNLGARLESGAKHWGIDVQVAHSVYESTNDYFIYRKLGSIRVKGKEEPIKVYELICQKGQESEDIKNLLNQFEIARKLYLKKKWDEAIKAFNKSNKLEKMTNYRKINPSQTYIKICNEFKNNPPDSNWDGTYNFKEK